MEKVVHYSRSGYNGNYTYTSVCGKLVKTHQDDEHITIHTEDTNCNDCLKSDAYILDTSALDSSIKNRIYIESDILQSDEFSTAQNSVRDFVEGKGLKCIDRVFSNVLDYAWHDLDKTWLAVKNCDEVYTISSLMPLSGGSYIGAPVIFNGMCKKAVDENVTSKSVYILNKLEYINWYMIDIDIMKKAFKHNDLYMYNDQYELEKIDVTKIPNKK